MNRFIRIFTLVLVLCFQVSAGEQIAPVSPKKENIPSQVTVAWAKRALQGFDMKVWISNQMVLGLQAWDGTTPDGFGLEYPTGSGIEHLYGAGPWIGAMIDGVARVTEGYNGYDARKEILPQQGDSILSTSQKSDKDFYCSATDTFHTPVISGHIPMGVKVSQNSYAWQPGMYTNAFVIQEYNIQNIGNKIWQNAVAGFMADMDIGPVSVGNFSSNNYAAFDAATKTAYMHNAIDRGSTPLGVTFLGTSIPLDSVRLVFRWWDFTTHQGPGTNDSALHAWISCEGGVPCLDSNQSPSVPSDGRVYLGISGVTMQPGDSIKLYYAIVSGNTIQEMLDNANRAQDVYNSTFVTGVNDYTENMPQGFLLHQNYPNPFNPSTTISYQLPARSHVTLRVFDLLGREVAMLVNRIEESGNKSVTFDASRLLSGVYYYRLQARPTDGGEARQKDGGQAGNFTSVKKLLLLK
ncbi:MAG: T9SS type A sorting domain-containing protein [Ignavibacteriales bacterium]|nr:T9SS type A sorting domain-containing protein [Ignavibacteriales bacterium]